MPTLTLSQTITSSDSRNITYDRLNEFAKLIEYKKRSDSLFAQFKVEVSLKDSILKNREKVIFQYKNEIVPGFERRIEIKDSTLSTQDQIFKIKETYYTEEIRQQKRKKWTWLGGGALVGLLIGVIFGGN